MNKEKFNLEKQKKEAKKHKRKSISLIDELKINQDESKKDLLPEEIEAYFWQDLYKQKLNEIKQSEDLKNTAIKKLDDDIKSGKNGNGENARWALQIISSIKGLKIYKKEFKQKLNEIKQSEKFKKTAIKYLENNIKLGKNGNGYDARWALRTISSIKNISNYWQSIADNKQAKKARNKTKERETFKRPELK